MACMLVPMTHKADQTFRIWSQEAVRRGWSGPPFAGRQRRREPLSAQSPNRGKQGRLRKAIGLASQPDLLPSVHNRTRHLRFSYDGDCVLAPKPTGLPCLGLTIGGFAGLTIGRSSSSCGMRRPTGSKDRRGYPTRTSPRPAGRDARLG